MKEWKRYMFAFLITGAIFATAILISDYFGQKRINEIKNIESRISVDILASETQFSLLSELSCKQISSDLLSKELAALGDKLSFMEESRGSNDEEVLTLKKYYSMLQIKDFILMRKIKERCGGKTLSLIYFYTNNPTASCSDCEKEGFVLTKLREDYPELRVYSFDYNLDLSALQTLITIYKIEDKQPALLIDDRTYYGFKSISEIKEILPSLKELDKQATSTTNKAFN